MHESVAVVFMVEIRWSFLDVDDSWMMLKDGYASHVPSESFDDRHMYDSVLSVDEPSADHFFWDATTSNTIKSYSSRWSVILKICTKYAIIMQNGSFLLGKVTNVSISATTWPGKRRRQFLTFTYLKGKSAILGMYASSKRFATKITIFVSWQSYFKMHFLLLDACNTHKLFQFCKRQEYNYRNATDTEQKNSLWNYFLMVLNVFRKLASSSDVEKIMTEGPREQSH